MTPLLQLIDVSRRFVTGAQEVTVLKNVNLSINAGEIVAIVGASGSGKSTLLNLLGCLDRPSEGSYRINGEETRDLNSDALAALRREHFGFIFQRYHLLPHLDAVANVEVPAIYAGTPPANRHSCARDLLSRLGLSERLNQRPSQLSGGQQQRVSIARALINGGQVILADEPTGALDSKSSEAMIELLRELNDDGHTVIIVTHDEKVAAHAHRIIEINDGEIIADRPTLLGRTPIIKTPFSFVGKPANGSLAQTRFFAIFQMAWRALLSHRLRTLLTMLGIIIGITSVVSVVGIGESKKRQILENISGLGANTITVFPGQDSGDTHAGSVKTLVPADVTALSMQNYVDSVTPETSNVSLLRYRNINARAQISGVGIRFFQVRGMKITHGRGFSLDDEQRLAPVVVIDTNTRNRLFGKQTDPVGQVILVGNLPCVVIGVTSASKNVFVDTSNLNVWMPHTTSSNRLFGRPYFDSIIVRVRDGESSQAAEDSLISLISQRHGRKDFFTYNMDTITKSIEQANQTMTLFLSTIAAISLIVGGIGVMNIMLVAVSERTHEIGIRMAVGARRGDILQQFLIEAVVVCLAGGVIGILLSIPFQSLLSWTGGISGITSDGSTPGSRTDMVFSFQALISAFLCSVLTGVVFGFIPASQASRLNPADALSRD